MSSAGIWIRTEPDIDGVYRVTLEFDQDHSVGLDPASALAYASEVLRAVAIAEYDAAVLAQMCTIMPTEQAQTAAMVVTDLRKDRPALNWSTPLTLVPGVSHRTHKGFLTIHILGKPVGQWEPADARKHALAVMEAVHVADLDSGYLRCLRGVLEIDEARARAAVGDLVNHR